MTTRDRKDRHASGNAASDKVELSPAQFLELSRELKNSKKAKFFADRVCAAATGYKPTVTPARLERQAYMRIAASFTAAIKTIDSVTLENVHFDPASNLSAWGTHLCPGPLRFRMNKSGAWRTEASPMPALHVLRIYLEEYTKLAERTAATLPKPGRGGQADFEKFRPVLLCAQEWIRVFQKKPGTGRTSPFVRACRVVLPLFSAPVPSELHAHVANAFKKVDPKFLSPAESQE